MTDPVVQYKEHLRAMFKDDPDTAQRVLANMGDGPWEGTGRLNLVVFGLVTLQRFQTDRSHEAVMKFVEAAGAAWASADAAPDPLHVELLIRSALGEPALFDAVPESARAVVLPIAAYVMIGDLDLSDEEIDQLLDDAERRATGG